MPKISVIVPVYNVEPYLDRCVQSILTQTFTDYELILVDDGSPDNCPAMCDAYAEKDSRVVVIHQQNGGLSSARNAGIDWVFANSDSEWITFIDSDDWVHEEYLERMYNAAVENDVLISVCEFERTTGAAPLLDQKGDVVLWNSEDFYVEYNAVPVIACCKLYKRHLFQHIRYPVGKVHEDEYTTHKLLFQCERIVRISLPLYAYYCNPNSITNSHSDIKIFDRIEAGEQQVLFFQQRNYNRAMKKSAWWLVKCIMDDIEKRDPKDAKNRNCVKRLRRKLRKYISDFRGLFAYSIKNNPRLYEIAYPCFMNVYWTAKGVWNKFGI